MQDDDSIFILIVEDDTVTQHVFRTIFKHINKSYNPRICPLYAADGKAAIELFNAHDIKLVFMNYKLPGGMYGDEVAIAMRKLKTVPTIWRSALGSPYALPRAKPFSWAGVFPHYGKVNEEVVLGFLADFGINPA